VNRFVIHIKKTRGSQRQFELFGFLKKTFDGYVAGGLSHATVFYTFENAENAAASFVMMNPIYAGRTMVRKIER